MLSEHSPEGFQSIMQHQHQRSALCCRELWGSCLGAFCEGYSLYLVLTWLPVYLVKERGLSMAEMAQLGAGVYALSALTSILTGWLSDRWLKALRMKHMIRALWRRIE